MGIYGILIGQDETISGGKKMTYEFWTHNVDGSKKFFQRTSFNGSIEERRLQVDVFAKQFLSGFSGPNDRRKSNYWTAEAVGY